MCVFCFRSVIQNRVKGLSAYLELFCFSLNDSYISITVFVFLLFVCFLIKVTAYSNDDYITSVADTVVDGMEADNNHHLAVLDVDALAAQYAVAAVPIDATVKVAEQLLHNAMEWAAPTLGIVRHTLAVGAMVAVQMLEGPFAIQVFEGDNASCECTFACNCLCTYTA